eukprot:2069749-Rhodomonas_salina.2
MSSRLISQQSPLGNVSRRLSPIPSTKHILYAIRNMAHEGRNLAAHSPAGFALFSATMFTGCSLIAVNSMEKLGLVVLVKTVTVPRTNFEGIPKSKYVETDSI